MSERSYHEILRRAADELSREELLQMSEELSLQAVRRATARPTQFQQLRGLGKETWNGINPDEYVAQERDSWDG